MAHSIRPCSASTIKRATSSRTLVVAQAVSCASVNFDFLSAEFIDELSPALHW